MNITDRRRNLGPAAAQPLVFVDEEASTKQPKKETKKPKLFLETGLIKTSNGSAYLENDKTIIITSIYGPRPNFTRTFNDQATLKIGVDFGNFIPVENLSIKSHNSLNQNEESQQKGQQQEGTQSLEITRVELCSLIESFCFTNYQNLILLKNYPKSSIEIFVQVISLNPTHSFIYLLSKILNCINAALVDSGLKLKSMASCGYFRKDKEVELLINVGDQEEILSVYSDLNDYNDEFKNGFSECLNDAKNFKNELNAYFLSQIVDQD